MRLTYIRSTISTLSPQTQSQTLASWTSSRFAVWRCTSTRRWTTRPSRRSWRRPSGCTTKKVSPCRWTRSRPNRIVCRQPTMRPIGWHWGAISRRSLHEMCFEKHTTTQPTNNKHIHTHTHQHDEVKLIRIVFEWVGLKIPPGMRSSHTRSPRVH